MNNIELKRTLKNETKTCYRFEYEAGDGSFMTLYLKKKQVDDAKINPEKGIAVRISQE